MAPDELVGLKELSELLGVTRMTASRYAKLETFPIPVERLSRGRLWRRRDVERWAKKALPLKRPSGTPKPPGQ